MASSTPKQLPSNHWIVIPAYNESRFIEKVLREVTEYTKQVVVVDDGSSDDTVELARKYTDHVVVHPVNLGKGGALKTGCEYALQVGQAEAIIMMDADDQHPADMLPVFSKLLLNGEGIVFGIRDMQPGVMPWHRIFYNHFLSYFVQVLFGTYIPDILSGYQAFSSKVYSQMYLEAAGYAVEADIAVQVARNKLSFSTVTIPSIYHDESKGATVLDGIQLILTILNWRLRW